MLVALPSCSSPTTGEVGADFLLVLVAILPLVGSHLRNKLLPETFPRAPVGRSGSPRLYINPHHGLPRYNSTRVLGSAILRSSAFQILPALFSTPGPEGLY